VGSAPAGATPAAPLPDAETPGRRPGGVLDPRALPTDMGVRFLLLVASVVSASLYLFEALWFVLRGRVFSARVLECGAGVDSLTAGSVADTSAALQSQAACRAQLSLEQSLFAAAGASAVLAVAYAGYLLLPRWRERRSRLEALDPVDGAALHDEVGRLGREADLARTPQVTVDATNTRVQGFVYGTGRRPRLAVTGGLAVLQVLDPPGFRAVLRHEVAHLANRDVPWTYFTVAVWWSFVAVALAPVVVLFAVSDPQYVLRLGWRTALLSALVLLVRNSVLRTREVYADARAAAAADGAAADLDRVLAAQPAGTGSRPSLLGSLLRRHPAAGERRALLADPDGLFRADLFTALAAGVAVGTTFHSVQSASALVLPAWAAVWVSALAVAPLGAAMLCVPAWRCALRSAARDVPARSAGSVGAGMGVGLALGPWLSFESATGGLIGGWPGAAGLALWAAGTVACVALLASYAENAAACAVEAAMRRPSPWATLAPHALATGAAVAAVLVFGHVTLLYLTGFGARTGLSAWPLWAHLPSVTTPWNTPAPALVVVGLLVAAPLVAYAARPRTTPGTTPAPASWPWRGEAPAALPPAARPDLAPVAVLGVVTGVVAALGHVAARVAGAAAVQDDVLGSDVYRASLGQGTVALLSAAAVVASGAGALLLPRRWSPLGILGGVCALGTGAALTEATFVAAGCGLLPRVGPADCAGPRGGELAVLVGQPAGFAVLVAALTVAGVGALRRSDGRTPSPSRPGPLRLVAALGLSVLLTGTAGAALAGYVARTQVTTVAGPGYEVDLPAVWRSGGRGEGGAPVLITLDQRVRVAVIPVDAVAPPAPGAPTLLVGGVRAHLAARESRDHLELVAFDLTAPPGSYRVVLVGAPDALAAATAEELPLLLRAVRWTPPGAR
jgi:Zn-dependent protease with chaperone function